MDMVAILVKAYLYCFIYWILHINLNVLQQTACVVVNPITVDNFAFLFNWTLVGRTSDSMTE